ncbi:MAG: TonB-dependent receptor [Bacteroidota bacterium]
MKTFSAWILFLFCLVPGVLQAQNNTLSGVINGMKKEPVAFATVFIPTTNTGAVSDEKGKFSVDKLPSGKFLVRFSAVGYETQELLVTVPGEAIKIQLKATAGELAVVAIEDKAKATVLNESALAIKSIDVKPLQARALSTQDILNRSAGVRVQQEGGLGSISRISVNGISGKSVRYFIDGFPLEYQGFGIAKGLNLVPITLIDRIDIYKGITPVELGSDALGGAINIVTSKNPGSFLDVSTERYSFNTWRTSVAGRYSDKKSGLYAQGQFYHNYSDNTYKNDVAVSDAEGTIDTVTVRRFHDRFRSYGITLEAGITNQKWAKLFAVNYSTVQGDKQIQNAFNSLDRPFGAANISEMGKTVEVKYFMDSIRTLPIQVALNANYSDYKTVFIDTVPNQYNWYGEVVGRRLFGGGEFSPFAPFTTNIYTKSNVYRASVAYPVSTHHKFTVSASRTSASRYGKDTTAAKAYTIDPFESTQSIEKLISGIGYAGNYWKNRINFLVSGKYYEMYSKGGAGVLYVTNDNAVSRNFRGWNSGVRVEALKSYLWVKLGMEHSARLPDESELFGDGVFVSPNPDLLPETSRNQNAGFEAAWEKTGLRAGVSWFRRDITNFIRFVPTRNYPTYRNVPSILVEGREFELSWSKYKWFRVDYNLTSQRSINRTMSSGGDLAGADDARFYNSVIPNTPQYFYNLGLTAMSDNLFRDDDKLSVYWNANYVRWYFLNYAQDGLVETKDLVPSQFTQNLGLSYALNNNSTSISLEVHNYEDIKVIDQFGIQNPGRSFHVKLRHLVRWK